MSHLRWALRVNWPGKAASCAAAAALSAQGELVMLCAASTLSLSVAPCPALNVAPSVKHLVNPTYVSSDGVIVSRDLGGCAEKGYFPLRESPPWMSENPVPLAGAVRKYSWRERLPSLSIAKW